jgi:hypothetical protein
MVPGLKMEIVEIVQNVGKGEGKENFIFEWNSQLFIKHFLKTFFV